MIVAIIIIQLGGASTLLPCDSTHYKSPVRGVAALSLHGHMTHRSTRVGATGGKIPADQAGYTTSFVRRS